MDRRMPLWAALSAGAAVLIGCGIFFALQDIGTANEWASIGSFFLALVTAVGSLLSLVRSKQEKEPAAHKGSGRKPARASIMFAWRNGQVVHGDHIDLGDVNIYMSPSSKKRKGTE
jgi:hypothetical protein